MSADGAADLRRRAAPSARTRHGGADIDAAEERRFRAKPALSFLRQVAPVMRSVVSVRHVVGVGSFILNTAMDEMYII